MKIRVNSNDLVVGEVYHDSLDDNSIALEFAGYSVNGNLLFKESIESQRIYLSEDGMVPFANAGAWYKEVK